MNSDLPSTPAEVLDLSTKVLGLKVNAIVKLAEFFKFWETPYRDAATSLEEMSRKDIYYWVYKSKNPIEKMEKEAEETDFLQTDKRIVKLPSGFKKQTSLTIGAGGDLLRAKGLEHSKDQLFENVSDLLFDQTISYANVESPITEQDLVEEVIGDKGPPIECCSEKQFDILKGHKDKNFTILNTANNHIYDMGVEGINKTHKVLAQEGIIPVGTSENPEEYGQGKIITKNGIKFGFVSTTFGLNGRQLSEEEKYRINVSKLCSKFVEPELDLLEKQLEHCKSKNCDFIIASVHWGYEFEFFPRLYQIEVAHKLVEMGVDTILSHHPHVIQPVEYYHTKRDPDRIAIIAYSLGSLTWGFVAPHLVLSMILNITLSKGTIETEERTYIEDVKVTPVFRSSIYQDGKTITRIEKLADHLEGSPHPRDYISEIKRYADLVLGEWYKGIEKEANSQIAA